MKKIFIYFSLGCAFFAPNPYSFALSLLVPSTNELVCVSIDTGALEWSTKLPFRADSRLDICEDNLRVSSLGEASQLTRIIFLDKRNGQIKDIMDEECVTFTGTRYSAVRNSDLFFREGWKLNHRKVIGGRLEFLDSNGTARWAIERTGICHAVFSYGDFVAVGSHEWERARRPVLSGYVKGAKAPLWVFDLNQVRIVEDRHSEYLSSAITAKHVYVYWAGFVFKLDRSKGMETKRVDCSGYGLSGKMMNEPAVLIPFVNSIVVFHKQNVLCFDEDLDNVLWFHRPNLEANLLPTPMVDGGELYFFRGLQR